MTHPFDTLSNERFISLTTFRKNGTPVATPLTKLAVHEGKLYVVTGVTTGKMKRLEHTKRVQVAPCTQNGKVTGQAVDGQVNILSRVEAQSLFDQKVLRLNPIMRVFNFVRERRLGGNIYLEITTA